MIIAENFGADLLPVYFHLHHLVSVSNMESVKETAPLLNEKEQESNHVQSQIVKHDEILSETKSTVSHFIVIIAFTAFAYASRISIEILYALTFTNNIIVITIFVYIGSLIFGLISLFGTSTNIANSFGFDKTGIIELVLMLIGIILESCAWNVYIWGIGYILSRQAVTTLCLTFISYMLPLAQSRQYTTYYYQVYVVAYLIGPVISGL